VSDDLWKAVLLAVPSTLLALATLIVGIRNSRQLKTVHETTNSKMSELLELTKKAAHAEGVKDEKERPKG
jgi:hypothetical protein